VPAPTTYRVVLNSDRTEFGGSGYPCADKLVAKAIESDGYRHSVVLTLPPLSGLVLVPEEWHRLPPKPLTPRKKRS
jgi:1,4-alpha-glucan branching enzyme